jgi:putative ABC transport system permease protein
VSLTLPDLSADAGRIVARRAVIRWALRLFRREWRQQLLVLSLLTIAVAATIWGTSAVVNAQLSNPNYPTYGTAAAQVTLPGTDPSLAADIAAVQDRWGPADLIENQNIGTGVTLRAESQDGHYDAPLVSLVSGAYPAGVGQVALTSQVAARYGAHVGGTWRAAGTTWRVTGIVQDPSNLADEFALVAPGRVTHPSQVIMLLGSRAVRQAVGNGTRTLPGLPAAAAFAVPNESSSGVSPATIVLVVEALGLVFIGLVSVAGFSVMAQRRLRSLGMLSAIGATERDLRLVMIANGLIVGVTGALAGSVLGFAAWFAYAPELQRATGHVVDAANLPWWAFAIGVVFAVATSVLASSRPARAMAEVPVVAALSGRPAPPKSVHRSAVPGVIALAAGLALLAFTGGLSGVAGGGGGHPLFMLVGVIAVIIGIVLLAPLCVGVLAAGANPRLPVAIRIALRDLVRYRARSGAALAAVTFAVFLAAGICLVASAKFDNPLDWIGPNLSGSQLIVYSQPGPGSDPVTQVSGPRLGEQVDSLAASLHARSVPLESTAATLYQVGTRKSSPDNFSGTVYIATPQLLAAYGIKSGQIATGTDILTMRPGLAGLPRMEMIWSESQYPGQREPGGDGAPPCTLSNDCVSGPVIATFSNLPGGTDAPNTVLTSYAVSKYDLTTQLTGWLIQAPAPLTAAQINAARQLALAYGVTVDTRSDNPDSGEFTAAGTALGIVIALSVLVMSVGLIRSETARDLRTLTATGASAMTRRMITAATAAALGLLGAVLGMAGAVIAGLAWEHSDLSLLFGDVPLTDVLILLIGLPLIAAVGGWLLAGREPRFISRQPLE